MLIFTMVGTNTFASEESDHKVDESIVIGSFDGNLIDYMDSDDPLAKVVSNVRVNSYATYNTSKGVQVTTKLYVPSGVYPKPQFTSMGGVASVLLNSKTYRGNFFKTANGTATIEASTSTGAIGKKGNKGTVTVSGNATSLNALGGGGGFGISYPITIP
ncbi:MAG: hypothetical protein ACRC3Y_02325 [Romboutsia sp.]|uniref:hypothetical protein n=1 Tax=Romboutsia sp. TaxID=1965302 RepID=UPI003F2C1DAE